MLFFCFNSIYVFVFTGHCHSGHIFLAEFDYMYSDHAEYIHVFQQNTKNFLQEDWAEWHEHQNWIWPSRQLELKGGKLKKNNIKIEIKCIILLKYQI